MPVNILPEILSIQDEIIAHRRDFHKHPELSFQEHRTSKIVAEKLTDYGLDVQTGVGKTGVVGILKGNLDSPNIALRADMDALPIQETGDVEYRSINEGVMHACGHDGHTAMLLGAAKILSQKKSQLKGTATFIFQPAEEGQGGARFMIEDGALNNVDEIYGVHLWNYQLYGEVSTKPGPIMAAADMFEITIKGKGGHGGMPHGTTDAILVSSHVIQALQTIVSRNTNPLNSTVVTVGKINGGFNFNVIADEVKLLGTTRAHTEDDRQMIITRMNEILEGLAKTYNAEIILDYEDGYPPTINDIGCAEKLLTAATKIVGEGAGAPYLSMGAEDFSYFAQKIPGCFFFVGSSPTDREPMSVPHHCSHFDIDERALLVGASTFVQVIEDLLI